MGTVSTPVRAFLSSLLPGTAVQGSFNLTVPLSVVGFEAIVAFIGVQPNTANISAGWEMYAYRSADGGNSYETVSSVGMSITRNPNAKDVKTMRLESGYWLLRIVAGSGTTTGATWSFLMGTVDQLTAILNQ